MGEEKNMRKALSRTGAKSGRIFVIFFWALLLYPLVGNVLDRNIELNGVTVPVNFESIEISSIMNGEAQSIIDDWIDENFGGRKFIIKLRSQILYSIFNISPNGNVVVGKDQYLYEPGYIRSEFAMDGTGDDAYYSELIDQLEQLQEILTNSGRELYIFITPSKAHFYKENIPSCYSKLDCGQKNDYKMLVDYLSKSDLKFFDSHAYMETTEWDGEGCPMFYPTGIHWSFPWGYRIAVEFEKYISNNSKWTLSTLEQSVTKCNEPGWPDADLYMSLNLFKEKTDIQYYQSEISVSEKKDCPNVFMRGGSFMGQSLNGMVAAGTFNKDFHLENSYWFKNKYTESGTLTAFDAYDEIPELESILKETDIMILECNETNGPNMSWGFIEYLLDHSEYFEREE